MAELLERAIRSLSPRWALQRQQYREALDVTARYDGARLSRRTRGWLTQDSGPNAEVLPDLAVLRARSHDLVRNNPYAAAGVETRVAYEVGTGIVPRSRTGNADLDRAANRLWTEWVARADLSGRHSLDGLVAQAARSRCAAGEALVLKVPLTAGEMRARGLRVPLAIQVLEPNLLDAGIDMALPGGGGVRQGVEVDAVARPVAYHLTEAHPGEGWIGGVGGAGRTRRIPADDLLHIFRQDRPGQLRGVPDLAPVMTRLRLLDEYEDAALQQALVQACLAAFVTSGAGPSKGPLEGKAQGAEGDERRKTMAPGMIERLFPGEDVKFAEPSGSGAFSEFTRHQLQAIAAGFGLTYDLLTGDLTQANYSSLRAGRLAFRRRLEQTQWLLLIPRLMQPIWDAFIAAARLAGVLPWDAAPWPVEWAPPRFEMIDPLKDAEAMRLMQRLGAMTWPQVVAEMGWDPVEQLAEVEEWNKHFDRSGVVLDGDPRRTAGTGGAQDSRQNAAVELGARKGVNA